MLQLVSGARLLIVEDDAALAQMLSLDFQERGYHVRLAGSVRQARRILSDWCFDLLLLDDHLPDGRGIELLEVCRSRLPTLGVVLSSAQTGHEGLHAMACGRGRFVPKPATAETLEQAFRELWSPGRNVD